MHFNLHRIGLDETQTLRVLEGGALDRHASYGGVRASAIRFKLRPSKHTSVVAARFPPGL